jgi:exodeoxyribonuclease VII large subunit
VSCKANCRRPRWRLISTPPTAVWSVTELTTYLKRLLEADPLLQEATVRGEISNFRRHSSGHLYFSLKDDKSLLSCVCFRGAANCLEFQPQEGQQVIAYGHVNVYEPQGKYQLMVSHLQPDGLGELHQRFEALKARLAAEGLFAPERKRPLPRFPAAVALCTSPTGAAIRDMLNILRRRWPLTRVVLVPTLVQGEAAPASIVESLRQAAGAGVEVIIVGRGGGSLEDLWAFNEEIVARAIFACPIPTISAVGHETDITIADLVADLRAPTPSAAAELVVPDQAELRQHLDSLASRVKSGLQSLARRQHVRLARLEQNPIFTRPEALLAPWLQRVDVASDRAMEALMRRLERSRSVLQRLEASLRALDPREVLQRGYALVQRARDGALVSRVAQAPAGEELSLALSDGTVPARVMGEVQGKLF